MAGRNIGIMLIGCILCASLVSVSATCQELEQCFTKFGASIASLGAAAQNPANIVDFFCQKPHLLTDCFEKYAGCETFKSIGDLIPSPKDTKAQLNVLCNNKDEYNKAVKCTMTAAKSMTLDTLQRSSSCTKKLLQRESNISPSDRCQLIKNLMDCSPLTKASIICQTNMMVLMKNNGIDVPCMDLHMSLSPKGRLGSLLKQIHVQGRS